MAEQRRRILDLDAELARKKARQYQRLVAQDGMYPLDAPGMPPAGPDFLRHAWALNDDTVVVKATKKREAVYVPGQGLKDLYRRALREPGFVLPVEVRGGKYRDATFVPGHIWHEYFDEWLASAGTGIPAPAVTGPRPAPVMVIGKMPWKDETDEGRNLINETGRILIETGHAVRIFGMRNWYVTNLCKFMPPDGGTTLRAGWIADCLPLLHQELRLVRPDYVLCLGADATKALLGEKYSVTNMQGRVVPYTFAVHPHAGCEPEFHTAQCVTVLHPANVARAQGPHEARQLERGLARFSLVLTGADFSKEAGLDHRVCTSLEEAREWAQEVRAAMAEEEPRLRILAVDAEWEGHHWCNANAWLATIQVSWGERKAICFHLRDEKGKAVFRDADGKPALKRLAKLLTGLVNDYRVAGHFFVSDLEMLTAEGFDFRAGFAVPTEDAADGTPAWRRCQLGEGGLDTAMMLHAFEETGQLGLDSVASRYTTCPAYWVELEEAVVALCKELGIKRAALEGYGRLPRGILIPYANYDADVTRRLAVDFINFLDADYEGNCCWEPFWESMLVQPVILEMHQTGIYVDRRRVDKLTVDFMTARSAVEEKIKVMADWPDPPASDPKAHAAFNIRSVQHVKEYLYGHRLNGKVTASGKPVRLRPPGARSLKVTPLLDTSKPPKRWADVVAAGREAEHSPSTGKAVLSILAQENPEVADEINAVRDYRFLDQVLKSVLRPPRADEGDWLYEPDPDDPESRGLMTYDAGIVAALDDDGHVRSHMYPTAETGRWKHARPNLANISKTRDPDYERLLVGPDGKTLYKNKLRSIFTVPPPHVAVPVVKWRDGRPAVAYEEGDWVLLEADLKGAELYGMAIMSGSKKMIEHAQRSINHPDDGYDLAGTQRCNCGEGGKPLPKCKAHCYPSAEFYDIHSNVAIMAFKLACHPSKAGLASVGKAHLRNIAKTVIFGIAYGRQAKAIALAAKEQRKPGEPEVTVEDAQAVIDAIFAIYPELVPFFAEAQRRALQDRWLCNCYGRIRRFPPALDYKLEGEFERQAMNYPIQSMIASLVDRWLATLHSARERLLPEVGEYLWQWQLQIHDALLVRCRPQYVSYIAKELIPWSLRQLPIYPTRLDGVPIAGRGPYYLGAEVEVFRHWGAKLPMEEGARLGVPAEFCKV